MTPVGRPPRSLLTGAGFVRRGLRIALVDPGLYLLTLLLFAAPSMMAGFLAATAAQPTAWQRAAMLGLPWITVVLGAVVVMMLVAAHAHGRRIGLGSATLQALRWTPRYLWTNAHTSIVFWLPTTALLEARAWYTAAVPADTPVGVATGALWWLGIAAAAIAIHTRTLLAPFFAIHGDLPGTRAALESWRLSGRHFGLCLSTFVLATAPVALPLALLTLGVFGALLARGIPLDPLLAAAPNLVWVSIQAVRPLLIPAAYALYEDLWQAEQARRKREGAPPLPALARALLTVTRRLPKLGRW